MNTSAFHQQTAVKAQGQQGLSELECVSQHLEILHLDSLVSQSTALPEIFEKYTLNNVREIHMV